MTSSIWAVPAYLPYLQPQLTPQAVAQAQDMLQLKLPAAYLALLEEQNGGYVRRSLATTPHEMIWGIGPHVPTITDRPWAADGEADDDVWLPTQPELLLPFDGDGHWHLCFDYRACGRSGEPRITYVDLDSEEESPAARDFSDFLSALTLRMDNITFGIMNDWPLQTVVDALDTAFGVRVDNTDTELHGYPVYRWPLGDGTNTAWAWLSPNRVPRGFVRREDPRHAELVDALPGTALRLPEQADVVHLLECTDAITTRVHDACIRAGFTARRIA